jgi:hypothetical protein
MSTQVQDTQAHPSVDHIDGVIMTATETTTTETLRSRPVRPPRGVLTAAGLAAFAAVALTPWLLTTSSQTETSATTPTWAVVSPEQAAPALSQSGGGWNAGIVDAPAAYVMFCQNSPVLCGPHVATLPSTGYLQFCRNSPTLCTVPKRN